MQNPKIKPETLNPMLQYIFENFSYKLFNNERIELKTPEATQNCLRENHDHPLAGHQGFQRTYQKIKRYYYWDNMKTDIEQYIKQCPTCQKSKTNFKPNKSPMEITTTSSRFCERIAMDIVGST